MTGHALRRQRAVARLKADALLVSHPANVRYLTGFTGSNAQLLLAPGFALLFTDPRYGLQVREETGCQARVLKGNALAGVARAVARLGFRKLAFESSHMPHGSHHFLEERLGKVSLEPNKGRVEKLRMVKSPDEVDLIRASVRLTSEAFDRALEHLRPGLSENFFAAEIEFQMRALGAEKPAFETIVTSGERSALVHARPSGDPILKDEVLLIDMGAQREGYSSDMTRTVFLGKPGKEVKRLYRAVLEAQRAAIDRIRPGVSTIDVDRAARDRLRADGLEELFLHSTGHGLGLEVHEPPRVSRRQKTLLEAGMVITVEPGVYRKGFGGIRIEDTVLVTETGCEVLTPTPKDLLAI